MEVKFDERTEKELYRRLVNAEQEVKQSALDTQVAGNHYKCFKIQPFEFFHTNQLPFHKADIIKRIMRYDLPTGKGKQDLEKIIHEVQMIIELEGYDSI